CAEGQAHCCHKNLDHTNFIVSHGLRIERFRTPTLKRKVSSLRAVEKPLHPDIQIHSENTRMLFLGSLFGEKSQLRSKSPLGTSLCPTNGAALTPVRKVEFKLLQRIPSSPRSHPAGDCVSCAWTLRASRWGERCAPGARRCRRRWWAPICSCQRETGSWE